MELSRLCTARCHSRSVRLVLLVVTTLCKGAFASLYGDVATCTFKPFDEAFASLLDWESLGKRAFAPLYGDVSVDGSFASLIGS